jgi:hypothetical protein
VLVIAKLVPPASVAPKVVPAPLKTPIVVLTLGKPVSTSAEVCPGAAMTITSAQTTLAIAFTFVSPVRFVSP